MGNAQNGIALRDFQAPQGIGYLADCSIELHFLGGGNGSCEIPCCAVCLDGVIENDVACGITECGIRCQHNRSVVSLGVAAGVDVAANVERASAAGAEALERAALSAHVADADAVAGQGECQSVGVVASDLREGHRAVSVEGDCAVDGHGAVEGGAVDYVDVRRDNDRVAVGACWQFERPTRCRSGRGAVDGVGVGDDPASIVLGFVGFCPARSGRGRVPRNEIDVTGDGVALRGAGVRIVRMLRSGCIAPPVLLGGHDLGGMLVRQAGRIAIERVVTDHEVAGQHMRTVANQQPGRVAGELVVLNGDCGHVASDTRSVFGKSNAVAAIADLVASDGQPRCARPVGDDDSAAARVPIDDVAADCAGGSARQLDSIRAGIGCESVVRHRHVGDRGPPDGTVACLRLEDVVVDVQLVRAGGADADAHACVLAGVNGIADDADVGRRVGQLHSEGAGRAIVDREALACAAEGDAAGLDIHAHAALKLDRCGVRAVCRLERESLVDHDILVVGASSHRHGASGPSHGNAILDLCAGCDLDSCRVALKRLRHIRFELGAGCADIYAVGAAAVQLDREGASCDVRQVDFIASKEPNLCRGKLDVLGRPRSNGSFALCDESSLACQAGQQPTVVNNRASAEVRKVD